MITPLILPLAVAADIFIGDPQGLPHPIRLMGRIIEYLEPRFRQKIANPLIAGFFFSFLLVAGTWASTALMVWIAGRVHPILGYGIEIILIYYCSSISSLQKAALQVAHALRRPDLNLARRLVSMIVGREVDQLEPEDVARATVETVAENLVDGCLSPLFFAFLGGAPLAMAYKMVNTLDSMIGYKNARYLLFGKTAARIDDLANFIPARCAVPIIALAAQWLTKTGGKAIRLGIQEGARHSSPNAGYPEASFSGALGIWLGGPNYYHGRLVDKPYIGRHLGPTRLDHIKKACDIMVLSAMLWLTVLWSIAALGGL